MSRRVEVWEAAAVGHRITHEDDLEPQEMMVVSPQMQQGIMHGGAAYGPQLGVGFATIDFEHKDVGDCPDPTGVIEKGSENTFIGADRRPAAIAHEDLVVDCDDDSDGPIAQGAMHVYVNGVPWARRNDELDCGARVGEGEPTLLIGGEPTPRKEKRFQAAPRHPLPMGPSIGTQMHHDPVDSVAIGRQLAGANDPLIEQRAALGPAVGRAMSKRDESAIQLLVTLRP